MSGSKTDRKIAIVTPWFGRELKGGAELQSWNLALRFAGRGYEVEVITTCCSSFQNDWSTNDLPAGRTTEPEGFSVLRFPVKPRDRAAFDRVCGYLLSLDPASLTPGVSPLSEEDESVFEEHLIRCPSLLEYLGKEGWRYRAFIFLPYLYGPILKGLPIVASRAWLQPCLHDEAYAYLRCVQRIFFEAKHILWNSAGEEALGLRLYGPAIKPKSAVVGEGVEPISPLPSGPDIERLNELTPFVLVLGRKDRGKGTYLVAEAFKAHRSNGHSSLNMVIAGPGSDNFSDPSSGIFDLGLVSEDVRAWLLRKTIALLQPSPNESFSRVIFEAWFVSKPVVARRSCLATAEAVKSSRGGWLAENRDEWIEMLEQLELMDGADLAAAGQQGSDYAAHLATWENVMDRYDELLAPATNMEAQEIEINLTIYALEPQRIILIAGLREVASWEISTDQPKEVDGLRATIFEHDRILYLETNRSSRRTAPDPRNRGFCLTRFEARNEQGSDLRVRLSKGWNRSEDGNGSYPRWSTGSAEITINSPTVKGQGQIHQVLPNLGYGDAIGNHSMWIREQLQMLGYDSEIFARHIAPEVIDEAHHLTGPGALPKTAALLYHHSIGTEITPWVCNHPAARGLIYHNITPAEFFRHYRPELVKICRDGRRDLRHLAPFFRVNVGDSAHNASELEENGFDAPGVLPLCIDPQHWSFPPDDRIMAELHGKGSNILFVGRIVPNKRHEDLIVGFFHLRLRDPNARLYLVGTADVASFYQDCLSELVRGLQLEDSVQFVGRVNEAQLNAYYRCASLFWCASEHEGFCVPLIEAMWFDVPVLSYASTAIPETLAGSGCLYHSKADPNVAADLAFKLLHDSDYRESILSGQRTRREAFLPARVRPILENIAANLQSLQGEAPPPPMDIGTPRTIAVVKLDHIGDLVLATPVFAALKSRFPNAEITAVVAPSSAPILEANPNVRHIVTYNAPWMWRNPPAGRKLAHLLDANAAGQRMLLETKFDLVVNLRSDHGNVPFAASIPHRILLSYTNDTSYGFFITHPLTRTKAMHATEQHRQLLAAVGVTDWSDPELFPSPAHHSAVEKTHSFEPGTIALFPGAGVPLKKWPIAKFTKLAHLLVEQGLPVVVIGARDELEDAEKISAVPGVVNLCGKFSLLETASALACCSALVSNDSAPVHIAAAMGTPVICITRPLVRDEFSPVGIQHLTCCANLCYNPCDGFDPTKRSIAVEQCQCIEDITVEDVLRKVRSINALSFCSSSLPAESSAPAVTP
ncbi:glycosyltransferase [Synoicihabitans lomoniglobus]|uniref:Glycosyltransferase n=1 Tax=Synoicihabitans lomoniglobus TaxID=2909285 RepID=A0AAF0CSU8_9BACT|nr:glycosyltransferase [Opitutaceae bacterium LMO-M01]WED67361.1 glycosyltransferase [Opitutaceae bacterium LMO-M01]